MSIDLFVIITLVLSLALGICLGIVGFKIYISKQNKKLIGNAELVLKGKRDNKIKIDGQEYEAPKFIVKDKDGNKKIIDVQGGSIKEYRRREEGNAGTEEVQDQEIETSRETSDSSGEDSDIRREEERTPRVRSVLSRTRRFG